jgi:Kef-type K+ transport system membrane component KefB
MDSVELCRELAIIIISAEVFGLLSEKLNIPRVAGEIIAGLVIGPSLLNVVQSSDFISVLAELGVIMLMFTAGLDTNMSDLRETGLKALLIACAGVAVPLVCGTASAPSAPRSFARAFSSARS